MGVVTRIKHVEKGKLKNKKGCALIPHHPAGPNLRSSGDVGSALPGSRLGSRKLKSAGLGRGGASGAGGGA